MYVVHPVRLYVACKFKDIISEYIFFHSSTNSYNSNLGAGAIF